MGNSYLKRSHWRLRRLSDPVLSVTKVHSSVMGWKFEGCGLTKHSACNGPRPSFRSDWVGLRIPPLPLGSTDPGLCPGGWLVQAPSGAQILVCAQEADLCRLHRFPWPLAFRRDGPMEAPVGNWSPVTLCLVGHQNFVASSLTSSSSSHVLSGLLNHFLHVIPSDLKGGYGSRCW